MKKYILILLFLAVILGVTGCTFYANLFIVNLTSDSVLTTIQLDKPIDQLLSGNPNLKLQFVDQVLKINKTTHSKMNNKVVYQAVDSVTIQLALQPHSTTLIGGGHNGRFYLDKFIFVQGSDTTTLTKQDLSRTAIKTGGVFPPYHFTYYINEK